MPTTKHTTLQIQITMICLKNLYSIILPLILKVFYRLHLYYVVLGFPRSLCDRHLAPSNWCCALLSDVKFHTSYLFFYQTFKRILRFESKEKPNTVIIKQIRVTVSEGKFRVKDESTYSVYNTSHGLWRTRERLVT